MNNRIPYTIVLVLGAGLLAACSDSGIDPETAEILHGDVRDTVIGPDLTKAVVKLGLVGSSNNVVVQDFIGFRHTTEYRVDTLDDGSVEAVSDLAMYSELPDGSSSGRRNAFDPVRSFRVRIPHLETGLVSPRDVSLDADPTDTTISRGGVTAMIQGGALYGAFRGQDDRFAIARIEGINTSERTISIGITGRLRPIFDGTGLEYIALEMLIELPY